MSEVDVYCEQRRDRVTRAFAEGLTHWTAFVRQHRNRLTPDGLFDRRSKINRCALEFLRHCAEICVGAGNADVMWSQLSSSAPGGWKDRPASWLWKKGDGSPRVLIDLGYVTQEVSAPERNKVLTRILLHEIGHVALQWDALDPNVADQASASTSEHEEQAWVFCGAILGLALGFLADGARRERPPTNDPTWRFA